MLKICKTDLLEKGEIVMRRSYLIIRDKDRNAIEVTSPQGVSWSINGRDIIETEISPTRQFVETIELPISKLAAVFANIPYGDIFQVCFTKKDGTERVLVGYRTNTEEAVTYLGLSQVVDLEVVFATPEKRAIRNIYHEKLLWLNYNSIHYSLKK